MANTSAGTDTLSVLQRLQREIAARPLSDQTPIESVLTLYADKAGIVFPLDWNASESGEVPALVKPGKLSNSDWQAFLAYWKNTGAGSDIMAEHQSATFTFVDLDEDGKNDLILEYYSGGTGLYSFVELGRRDALKGFVFEPPSDDMTYSINGRGADQAIYFLRVDGKFYIAYRDGIYGRDSVTLDRAFPAVKATERENAIIVRYRYRHMALPPETSVAGLSRSLVPAINRQLASLQFDQNGKQTRPDPASRCPAPNAADEDEQMWPWHDAGHYTFDYVADFPITSGQACYSASIVAYKSSYLMSNERCCSLQVYDGPGSSYAELALKTVREQVSVGIEAPPR